MRHMSNLSKTCLRWLKSTSNRTFMAWPLLLLATQTFLDKGALQLNWWPSVLLVWGYVQYRLVGTYRSQHGGGGPGLSVPPERLVTTGPYGLIRNPMYLGHLVFFFGLALMFSGVAWLILIGHTFWFDQRARLDERHLLEVFGESYAEYMRRVKRWLPAIY